MNPDPKLNRLLKEWEPKVELPSRFEPEVWRRIAISQDRSRTWYLDWAYQLFESPKRACALVAVTMVLGTGIGVWQASTNYQKEMDEAHSRYLHSVDPFTNVSLASN